MQSRKRSASFILILATAITGLAFIGQKDPINAEKKNNQDSKPVNVAEAKIGNDDKLPVVVDFTLRSLDGGNVGLMDVVRKKKITIVNFFATWCPPCRAETPDFVRLYKEYKGKGIEYLSIDIREKETTVKRFAKEFGMTNPILLDSSGKVSSDYGVYSIPSTLIVDSKGRVIDSFTGLASYDALKRSVENGLGR